jgi:hypothetical protein
VIEKAGAAKTRARVAKRGRSVASDVQRISVNIDVDTGPREVASVGLNVDLNVGRSGGCRVGPGPNGLMNAGCRAAKVVASRRLVAVKAEKAGRARCVEVRTGRAARRASKAATDAKATGCAGLAKKDEAKKARSVGPEVAANAALRPRLAIMTAVRVSLIVAPSIVDPKTLNAACVPAQAVVRNVVPTATTAVVLVPTMIVQGPKSPTASLVTNEMTTTAHRRAQADRRPRARWTGPASNAGC